MTQHKNYILIILLLAISIQAAVFAAPMSNRAIALFQQGMSMRAEADDKLVNGMEDVADWMIQFKLRFGHFPEPGVEQDRAKEYLENRLLPENPYKNPSAKADAEPEKIHVKFLTDPLLTPKRKEAWEKKPPESWTAPPGTITIIENSEKCVLIWGSSADRAPLIDAKTNTCRVAWRELQ